MPLKRPISSVASVVVVVVVVVVVAVVVGALVVAQPQRPSSASDVPALSAPPIPTSGPSTGSASSAPATHALATGPIQSHGPTDAVCCSPSPTALVDALEQSDQFWERWLVPIHFGLYYDSASLAEQFEIADLVVRGPIVDLYIGEYWRSIPEEDPYPLAYMRIDVQEVLKGEPASRTAGDIEIQLGAAGADLETIRAALPDHDNLWFLKGPEGYEGRGLSPQNESEIAPFAYTTTNDYQGVLRNIDGVVEVVGPDRLMDRFGPDHFPLALDGTNFQIVLDGVLGLIESPATAPPAASP